MGIYATVKSKTINQSGAGSINTIIVPPIRKNAPTIKANVFLCVDAIFAAIKAPANVPKAWAKKGKMKNFKSQFIAFIGTHTGKGKTIDPATRNAIFQLIQVLHQLSRQIYF